MANKDDKNQWHGNVFEHGVWSSKYKILHLGFLCY